MTLFFFSLFFFIGPKYELNSEKDRKKVFRELRCNKYKMEEYFEKNTNYYYFFSPQERNNPINRADLRRGQFRRF